MVPGERSEATSRSPGGHTSAEALARERAGAVTSHREGELGWSGGLGEEERAEGKAELGESLLGGLAGGVEGGDGAATAEGAAQHVGAEGAAMQSGPVDARAPPRRQG